MSPIADQGAAPAASPSPSAAAESFPLTAEAASTRLLRRLKERQVPDVPPDAEEVWPVSIPAVAEEAQPIFQEYLDAITHGDSLLQESLELLGEAQRAAEVLLKKNQELQEQLEQLGEEVAGLEERNDRLERVLRAIRRTIRTEISVTRGGAR